MSYLRITKTLSALAIAAFVATLPFATIASAQALSPFSQTGPDTSALNWAGYVATGGTYTSVSGSWVVPTVQTNSSENVADATWVGIGGVTSTDLIQAGTEAIPNSQGDLVYQAWYETLPQDSTAVPLSISPGDAVSVSITEIGQNRWEISFDNATTGKTYETSVNYASSLSSADWIEEMPIEIGGVIGLDDFGTIQFTSGYAIKNGQVVTIQSAGATALTMDNSQGAVVATPSALGANGSNFSVARTNAPSTPLALAGVGISAVAGPASPYIYVSSGGYSTGGYTLHTRRARNGYHVIVRFQ